MCRNLKFLTAKEIEEKPNLFAICLVLFAPHTQTYATELKEYSIVLNPAVTDIQYLNDYKKIFQNSANYYFINIV
jgi:hypothetical protein